MLSFKKLEEILGTTVTWEQQMKDLYDVAELGLKTEESKKLLAFLKESHQKHLKVLLHLNVNDYGPDEWIKFTADFGVIHQIPQHQITRDSTAEEIFNKVKSYEESLQSVYQRVSEHTVSESQTELFSSLALMKGNQLSAIKNFMESYFNPNLG
jgi:rubrerythrin